MKQEPIVQIRNLQKNIGKKEIIKGISFDIFPGEIFGFLGPNGAGKTTTIRMMVGLMSVTEGDITIKGLSIRNHFEKAIIHVGGIVENPELYKFLTGYQNLVHYARMMSGVSKERIYEVIRLVGLEDKIHEKVKTYSLGMRQRLGLAQALLHAPSLLILDEPTNGLDPAGIREIRDYLRKIARDEGIAVFVSSHLLSEMEQMCDRVGIIQNGTLVDVKAINEFMNKENNLSVLYTVEPLNKAKEILEKIYSERLLKLTESGIEMSIKREEIPEITNKLVKEGIQVYGITTASKTLEARFLEVTGGYGIA